jgi:competence protein ComEC
VREGASSILIDTGPGDTALLKALAQQGLTRLDAVILTHLDSDHTGALDVLAGTVAVGKAIFATGIVETNANHDVIEDARKLVGDDNIVGVAQGARVKLGASLSLEVLWPDGPVSEGKNSDSICMLLYYDSNYDGSPEYRLLLTGDAEAAELEPLNRAGLLGDIDVLKVGHHGSSDAVSAELLQTLKPEYAIISVGAQNRYGHPTEQTLQALREAGAAILRTDENGSIKLEFGPGGIEVSCANM